MSLRQKPIFVTFISYLMLISLTLTKSYIIIYRWMFIIFMSYERLKNKVKLVEGIDLYWKSEKYVNQIMFQRKLKI